MSAVFRLLPALAPALLGACATLTAPKTDLLAVTSNPAGAEVRVNGQVVARTPAAVELERRRPSSVEVSLPGYYSQACPVRLQPSNSYVVPDVILCILLFPIGCIAFIDAEGAWNELDPRACYVSLAPGYATVPPPVSPPPLPPPGYAPPPPAQPPQPPPGYAPPPQPPSQPDVPPAYYPPPAPPAQPPPPPAGQ